MKLLHPMRDSAPARRRSRPGFPIRPPLSLPNGWDSANAWASLGRRCSATQVAAPGLDDLVIIAPEPPGSGRATPRASRRTPAVMQSGCSTSQPDRLPTAGLACDPPPLIASGNRGQASARRWLLRCDNRSVECRLSSVHICLMMRTDSSSWPMRIAQRGSRTVGRYSSFFSRLRSPG